MPKDFTKFAKIVAVGALTGGAGAALDYAPQLGIEKEYLQFLIMSIIGAKLYTTPVPKGKK